MLFNGAVGNSIRVTIPPNSELIVEGLHDSDRIMGLRWKRKHVYAFVEDLCSSCSGVTTTAAIRIAEVCMRQCRADDLLVFHGSFRHALPLPSNHATGSATRATQSHASDRDRFHGPTTHILANRATA